MLVAMCGALSCSRSREPELPAAPPPDDSPHGQMLRLLQASAPRNVIVSQSSSGPQWLRVDILDESQRCGWSSEVIVRLLSGLRPDSFTKPVEGVPSILVKDSAGFLAARCDFLKRLSAAGFVEFQCQDASARSAGRELAVSGSFDTCVTPPPPQPSKKPPIFNSEQWGGGH